MTASMRLFSVLVLAAALAGCSAASSALPPMAPAQASHRVVKPNEGAEALPGEGANALPGAILPCVFSAAINLASCTMATNITLPPISDATTPSSLIPGLHPADILSAYGIVPTNATGTVAIVDAYDSPLAEADLAVYRATFGMPPCTSLNGCFRKVSENGAPLLPIPNLVWNPETALDLEMVSAVCPKCQILLVEANSASIDDLGKSVDTAVAMGARAVSNSYATFEWSGERAEDVHYNHPGVAITASSGDAAETFYPAASPYVTAVGGTTLVRQGSSWGQSAWKFGGSGCSRYEPRPRYQRGIACASRSAVDFAVDADPQTGVATFAVTAGGWIVAGGTSVGAPIAAAMYVLGGHPAGPGFSYVHRGAFHDLGVPGYDPATGLGAPVGVSGL